MEKEKQYLLAVNGTLMRGLALEENMRRVHAAFCHEAQTERSYRLWSMQDAYPAMLRVDPADPLAAKIAVEIWSVPASGLAEILYNEPAGLSIGKVRLDDGRVVFGVLGEAQAVEGMREITSFCGWRSYIASDSFGKGAT